jgi:hypothetical protein
VSTAISEKRLMQTAAAREREAEREHELAMHKQLLDCIAVLNHKPGCAIVMTLPKERFIYPHENPQEVAQADPEKMQWMATAQQVLITVIESLNANGKPVGAGAILGEGMRLEDLPMPGQEMRRETGLVLPPGTKI